MKTLVIGNFSKWVSGIGHDCTRHYQFIIEINSIPSRPAFREELKKELQREAEMHGFVSSEIVEKPSSSIASGLGEFKNVCMNIKKCYLIADMDDVTDLSGVEDLASDIYKEMQKRNDENLHIVRNWEATEKEREERRTLAALKRKYEGQC